MKKVLIRFNTENKGDLFWRLIIDGEEHLCNEIQINCMSHTSKDDLPDGRVKWHIACFPKKIEWPDSKQVILS